METKGCEIECAHLCMLRAVRSWLLTAACGLHKAEASGRPDLPQQIPMGTEADGQSKVGVHHQRFHHEQKAVGDEEHLPHGHGEHSLLRIPLTTRVQMWLEGLI